MDRLSDLLSAGCSGMCSPERVRLSSQVERAQLMTGPVFLGCRSSDKVGVQPIPCVPGCILPRLTWWDPAKLGGTDKITWETEIVLKIRNRMFRYLPAACMIPSGGSIRPHGGIS